MPAIRMTAILTLAVTISAAAISARFVGEQIEYLYEKLAPPAQNFDFATDFLPTVKPLPSLEPTDAIFSEHCFTSNCGFSYRKSLDSLITIISHFLLYRGESSFWLIVGPHPLAGLFFFS